MAGEGDSERLVVLLEARIRDFEKNMDKASGSARRNFADMRRGSQSATRQMEADMQRSTSRINQMLASTSTQIGSFAKGFAGGIVGGLSVGSVMGLVNSLGKVAESVAAIGDEAKRAGLSTKSFQELKFVAEQNRIGVDSLVDGIKELNLRADEFITTGGGSAADAFKRLGYDAATLKDKLEDPSALFSEIIGKLGELDTAAQIRVADEVFGGNGGEKFVQLIQQGEAGIRATIQAANDLGIVMDEKMIAKADEVDRKFKLVAATVGTNLKGAIVEAFESFGRFMDLFQEFQDQRDDSLNLQIAEIGMQRLKNENEVLRLKAGGKPDDGIFGTSLGASTSGEMVEQLTRENEALAEQERRILDVVSARDKLRGPSIRIGRPQTIDEDRATRFRPEDAYTLPGRGPTPAFRQDQLPFDPYFGGGDDKAGKAGAKAGESMAVEFIKKFEGFRKSAYWDVNAFRAGYGSDTTTRESGKVEQVTASTVVSLADANRDLARRLEEFKSAIVDAIGADTWQSFTEEQQAALESIAYNYGSLPDRIVEAIKSGNPAVIGAAIRDLGDDNGGVNRSRRSQEADMFLSGSGGGDTPAIRQAREHKKAVEDLQHAYDQLGQIGMNALNSLADALADGKLEGKELLKILFDVVMQLLSMPSIGGKLGTGGGGGFLGSLFGFIPKLFGFADGGPADGGQRGGDQHSFDAWLASDTRRHNGSGPVFGPGGARDDRVPAWLSPGEFVVNARATRKHRPLIESINADRPIRRADGGGVGMPRIQYPDVAGNGGSGQPQRVEVHVVSRFDANGKFETVVEKIATRAAVPVAKQAAAASLDQYDKTMPARIGDVMERHG